MPADRDKGSDVGRRQEQVAVMRVGGGEGGCLECVWRFFFSPLNDLKRIAIQVDHELQGHCSVFSQALLHSDPLRICKLWKLKTGIWRIPVQPEPLLIGLSPISQLPIKHFLKLIIFEENLTVVGATRSAPRLGIPKSPN